MNFRLEQSVKLNSKKVKEDIDRGIGKIVEFTTDGYISVDFRVPEYENLWLLPEEIEPVALPVRKSIQSFNFNVINCGGRPYEVPSNEPDDDGIIEDGDGERWSERYKDLDSPVKWIEF